MATPGPAGDVAVFTYGDFVGWHAASWGGAAGSTEDDTVVDLSGRHPPLQLPDRLVGLSENGAITTAVAAGGVSYTLRTWDGRAIELLPSGTYLAPPQLVGWTAVWIDDGGRLRARRVTPG